MNYESGLRKMKRLLQGTNWYTEFLVLESALRENLEQERLYGPSEQSRRDRSRVVYHLNSLALANLNNSFNDLCLSVASLAVSSQLVAKNDVSGIFVSYAKEDGEKADKLREHLISFGLNVWKDTADLYGGEEWERKIKSAISESSYILICMSKASLSKVGFFQLELTEALYWQRYRPMGRVFVIPVRFEQCSPPVELRKYQYIDLFPNWCEGVERVVDSIRRYDNNTG